MGIALTIVIMPLNVVLFIISGLIINLIQQVCFVLVRPFSENTYRRINKELGEILWLELVCLVDWCAGVKIELYTDPDPFSLMGKEHALRICNHRSDIDWLVGWVLAQVHVHLKRHLMKDLPEIDDDVAQWCKEAFVVKDALLDKHVAENSFNGQPLDLGLPVKSLSDM